MASCVREEEYVDLSFCRARRLCVPASHTDFRGGAKAEDGAVPFGSARGAEARHGALGGVPMTLVAPAPSPTRQSAIRQAPESLRDMRILLVDDEPVNVRLVSRVLQLAGYRHVETLTDSCAVISTCMREGELPDLLVLDLMMPEFDGFDVMRALDAVVPPEHYLPILVLTADISPSTRNEALSAGAKDFLSKPFDTTEILLRIQNLLEVRSLYSKVQEQKRTLESRVRERTRDLEDAQIEILGRLARAGECRDDDTGHHAQRVGEMAARIGAQLGLSAADIDCLRRAAPLHDVGKIGISDTILLKPGKLTAEEFNLMKTHAETGARLLAGGTCSLVQMAEIIALSHHERWDGTGYPYGLQGESIPLPGRIVALCDVYDALTNERPYKKAWSHEEAVAEIERCSGRHFDPRVVAAFVFASRFC